MTIKEKIASKLREVLDDYICNKQLENTVDTLITDISIDFASWRYGNTGVEGRNITRQELSAGRKPEIALFKYYKELKGL